MSPSLFRWEPFRLALAERLWIPEERHTDGLREKNQLHPSGSLSLTVIEWLVRLIRHPWHVLLQTEVQRRFTALLTADDRHFEALPNRPIDSFLFERMSHRMEKIDVRATVVVPNIRRHHERHDGIAVQFQFAIDEHLAGELSHEPVGHRRNSIVRKIKFEADHRQVFVEFRQLIERQINGEDQRSSLVRVQRSSQSVESIVTEIENVERVDEQKLGRKRCEPIV